MNHAHKGRCFLGVSTLGEAQTGKEPQAATATSRSDGRQAASAGFDQGLGDAVKWRSGRK